MKKLLGILSLSIFSYFPLQAQIAQNNVNTLNDISFFVNVNNSKYQDAEGTKYIDDTFIPANINDIKKTFPVRFDVVDNIMEFKENSQEIMGISPTRDYRIEFSDGSNRIFTSKTIINEEGDLQRLFLEEIKVSSTYSLYIRKRIKFQPAKPAKSSYEPETPAVFRKMSDLFYVDYPDDSIDYLLQIPKNRKKAKLFFGDLGSDILKFAKKESLKFDSQKDLIKILNQYTQSK